MRKLIALAVLFVLALTGSAFAQTADDVILLAQKGVGEEILIAFVEASRAPIALSVADIVRLKDANVPDKVVVAMLRQHPAPSVAARRRPSQEGEPEYPVVRGDRLAPVEYQPAPQRIVEVPSTTYVYSDYPSAYYGDYYYPSYYPYYYPSLFFSFGSRRPFFHHSSFSSSFPSHHFSSFPSHQFSNFHTGFSTGFGYSNLRPHSSVSTMGGGGFHGRR